MFAGVGGFDLGFAKHGLETVLFSENDPSAAAVLAVRFPGVPNAPDVRELVELPRGLDVLTAGFPCQDLSQAGSLRGLRGARSGLVREVFRLLEHRPVPWVVIENVPFTLHLHAGAAIARITRTLGRLGYHWAYRVVDAMAFGLPQRRRRLFLVASLAGDPRAVLHAQDTPKRDEAPGTVGDDAIGFYWTEGNRGVGWAVDAVPTLKGGSGHGIPSPPAVMLRNRSIVTPRIEAAERLQGFPSGWTDPGQTSGRSWRWRMVGNAVNVRAADWLGSRLAAHPARVMPEGRLRRAGTWPQAAYGDGNRAYAVELSSFPISRPRLALEEVLAGDTDSLSVRAARVPTMKAKVARTSRKRSPRSLARSRRVAEIFRCLRCRRLSSI